MNLKPSEISKPLTVITIVKNDPLGLKVTAESIEVQSVKPVWLIVCPASENETSALAYQYVKSGIAKGVEHDPGGGIYPAMNYALTFVDTGHWVLFLNAGDALFQKDTCKQLLFNLDESSARWAYGGHIKASAQGELIGESTKKKSFDITSQLFAKNFVSHQAFVCKIEELNQINGFSEDYLVAADWDLMVRVALRSNGKQLAFPICVFRLGGYSTKMRHRSNFELLKLRRKYLPWSMQFASLAWFIFRLARNQILIIAEFLVPRLLDRLKMRRMNSSNLQNHDVE